MGTVGRPLPWGSRTLRPWLASSAVARIALVSSTWLVGSGTKPVHRDTKTGDKVVTSNAWLRMGRWAYLVGLVVPRPYPAVPKRSQKRTSSRCDKKQLSKMLSKCVKTVVWYLRIYIGLYRKERPPGKHNQAKSRSAGSNNVFLTPLGYLCTVRYVREHTKFEGLLPR